MPSPHAGTWCSRHRVELGLSLRMTVAGLLSFAVAQLLPVTNVYWAVLTAIIVMQASIGGSLKATLDRLVGTLGGAGWGAAVTIGIPHQSAVTTGIALGAALIPLSLLVAFRPSYRIAPMTAAIVLLGHPESGGVVETALDRVFEIGLGSVVALAVALSISPARAHRALCTAARDALIAMAEQIAVLLAGAQELVDADAVLARHDRVRAAIERVTAASDEAARERRSLVSDAPDAEPLVRTLRRLSHDLVIIARALPTPLPQPVRARLAGSAAALGAALAVRLRGIGDAVAEGAALPPYAPINQAFDAYGAALAALRHDGLTRTLTDEDVERIFGLAFGLEQLRQNLDELAGRVAELPPR